MKEKIKIIGIGNQAYKIVKKNILHNHDQWDYLLIKKNKEGCTEIINGEDISFVTDIEAGKDSEKEMNSIFSKALKNTNIIILIANAGDEYFNETMAWLNPMFMNSKIPVWGILILPFKWEGMKRLLNAKKSIETHSSIISTVVILEPEKMIKQKNVITTGDAIKKIQGSAGIILTALHRFLITDKEFLEARNINNAFDNIIHSAIVRYDNICSAARIARDLLFSENISLSIMNRLKIIYIHISSREELDVSAENIITEAVNYFFRDESEIRIIKTRNNLQKKSYIITFFGFIG